MKKDVYRLLIQNAPFGYAYHEIVSDNSGNPVDYRFIEVNSAFEHLTGLKASMLEGKLVSEAIPGISEGKFDWIEYYGRIALEGGIEEFEQYSEPLGKWFKVQAFSPEKGYFSTVFTDISKERNEKEEFERFFSVNLDLLCIADTEGNFIKTNRAWEQVLGYTTEQLDNRKFLDFVHPDDIPSTIKAMAELSEQKQVLDFVNRYRQRDGNYRYIQWRSHPYGRYIYAAARDITAQMDAEQKLKESEKKYRLLAQNSADVIWVYDIESRRYLYVSPSAERLCGYSAEEVMNIPLRQLFTAESFQTLQELIPRYAEEFQKGISRIYTAEVQQIRKDGTDVWTEVTFRYGRDEENSKIVIHGASRDITERKTAEKEKDYQNRFHKMVADLSYDFVNATTENIGERIDSMLETAGGFFNAERAVIVRFSGDGRRVEQVNEWCRDGIDSMREYTLKMKRGSLPWMVKMIEKKGYLFIYDTSEIPKEAVNERKAVMDMGIQSVFTVPLTVDKKFKGYFSLHFVSGQQIVHDNQFFLLRVISNIVSNALGRNRLEQDLMKASITDHLTGLYNRRHLFSRLYPLGEESRRRKSIFSLIMFDIDHFKKLNDTAGHSAGDFILQQFASILVKSIRMFDIACRYGGEEFLTVIIGSGKQEALATAERILDTIRNRKFSYEGKTLRITVSCGIADSFEVLDKQYTPEKLIEIADRRLYLAKRGGRDRSVISDKPG